MSNNTNDREKYYTYYENPDLSQVKSIGPTMIYPIVTKELSCVMMLLDNLAKPEWVSIDCKKPLLSYILCSIDKTSRFKNDIESFPSRTNFLGCSEHYVQINGWCFLFAYLTITKDKDIPNKLGHVILSNVKEVQSLKVLFSAVSILIQPVILLKDTSNHKMLTYLNFFSSFSFKVSALSGQQNISGFVISRRNLQKLDKYHHLFKCSNGVYIGQQYICDGKHDCLESGSDEANCTCSENTVKQGMHCKVLFLTTNISVCSLLYNHVVSGQCIPFVVEPFQKTVERFQCTDDVQIDNELVNDLVIDCMYDGKDEHVLKDLLVNENQYFCENQNMIPCQHGHISCFNISDICKYRLNGYSHLIPCRTGGHIEECTNFECSLMFKCPGSYCIPWAYVCDGKWDCPIGIDESTLCKHFNNCTGLFQCRNSRLCIPLANVCDTHDDCLFRDDESNCDLQSIHCPEKCQCLAYAFVCFNMFPEAHNFLSYVPYKAISILFASGSWKSKYFQKIPKAEHLILIGNNIKDICGHLMEFKHLVLLDLSYNLLFSLKRHCFSNLPSISVVSLSRNGIANIESHSFYDLPKLRKVDLKHNKISSLPMDIFDLVSQIDILILTGNNLQLVHSNAFEKTAVNNIESNDFLICCAVSTNTNCKYVTKYASCKFTVLPNIATFTASWTMSIVLISVNVACVILHVSDLDSSQSFNILVISVNLNDIAFSLYLMALPAAEAHYDKTIFGLFSLWRSSTVCFVLFFVKLTFSLASPALVTLVSMTRLMVVLYPLDTKFKLSKHMFRYISYMLISIALASLGTTTWMQLYLDYLPSNLCTPFIDPKASLTSFKIITSLVGLVRIVANFAVIVMYLKLMTELNSSRAKANMPTKASNYSMTAQFIIVSLSNIICWLPSSGIYIYFIFNSGPSSLIPIWSTLLIMPVNSLVNPIIFFITSIRKLRRERKESQWANVNQQKTEVFRSKTL